MINTLSTIWIISLAFYHFSVIGTLSVDNLLAPFLFVILIIAYILGMIPVAKVQINNLIITILSAMAYLFVHSISLVITQDAVWTSLYETSKNILYFLLPVMFIKNEEDIQRTLDALVLVAIIGCLTAMITALEIVQFDFQRTAESRLAAYYVTKSVGFITSYGDMGLLIALSLLMSYGGMKDRFLFGSGGVIKFLIILCIITVGIISLQSRNVLLTILISIGVYIFLGLLSKKGDWRRVFYVVVIGGLIFSTVILFYFGADLINWIRSVGGTSEAAATVDARLDQYDFAVNILEGGFMIGAHPSAIEKYQLQISFIHNMWLKELVQGGLLGVFSFIIIYIRALKRQVNTYYVYHKIWSKGFASVMIGVLVATQFYPAGTSLFWVLLGVATALPRVDGQEQMLENDAPKLNIVHRRANESI